MHKTALSLSLPSVKQGWYFQTLGWAIKIRTNAPHLLRTCLRAVLHIKKSDVFMLSAYSRTYDVRVAQSFNPSPKVLQLQGLPPSYPESSGPGKQGRQCFLLTLLLSSCHCVQLIWSLSLPGQTPPSEDPQAPKPCGCAPWSSLSCSRNVYGEPPSLARTFAEN